MKYIVTFDISNEGIPTPVLSRESLFSLVPQIEIVSIHTGDEAVRIWEELKGRAKESTT